MGSRPSIAPPVPRVVERFFECSLLGMLAAGFFAIAGSGFLDWPTSSLMLGALGLRAMMTAGVLEFNLSNRFVAAVSLLCIGFFPLDFLFVSGTLLRAAVHLVCFLGAVKVISARTNRDYTILKMVAVMELMAAAVLSVSVSFLGFLALFLLLSIGAFTSGEVRRSAQMRRSVARHGITAFPRRLIALSVFLFCGILTLTAGMFFVLPRTARAAFERFMPQRYHLPGFSNGITLGQIGEIKRNSAAVMHVQSTPPGDGLLEVKWRGASLGRFDGKRWDNPPARAIDLPVEHGVLIVNRRYYRPPTRPGRTLIYTVQLNDIASDTLFVAGMPQTIGINLPLVRLTRSGSFTVQPPPGVGGFSYSVWGFLEDENAEVQTTPEPLVPRSREELLQLPPLDPRIAPLAREMAAGASTEEEKAWSIESRLRRDYGYTLELLPAAVSDPLANFLFERKKGHCEYFASAMAVMLRTLGIPSRVVTGFQSGVYNPITRKQVVRASDAHSWVEAWITGRGWTSFDPTPSDPNAASGAAMQRLSLFFDAAEQFWQNWVLLYDFDRQAVLASRVDESARKLRVSWMDGVAGRLASSARQAAAWAPLAAIGAALAIGLILYGPALIGWWRGRLRVRRLARGEGQASDATLLYRRMLDMLARRGIHKPPWLTPAEFARVVPQPEIRGVVSDLTGFYNEFRYGGRRDAAPRMVQLLDQLERL
jgi:protein-glutamine gamma-glutamyltransferase